MSAETVIAKIEQMAKAEADAIINDAKIKAQSEAAKIIAEAKKRADTIKNNASKKRDELLRGAMQASALDLRMHTLEKKRNLLEEAKKEAYNRLTALSDSEWCDIFKNQVLACAIEEDVKIIPSPDTKSRIGMLADALNQEGKASYSVSDDVAGFNNGFILSCQNYDVEISLDKLLQNTFDKNEKRFCDILFAGENL